MPELRIGDAERDRAVSALQEHYAAGRLDLGEFEERMQPAVRAKTGADLRPLFEDLPSLTPRRPDPDPVLTGLPTLRPPVHRRGPGPWPVLLAVVALVAFFPAMVAAAATHDVPPVFLLLPLVWLWCGWSRRSRRSRP